MKRNPTQFLNGIIERKSFLIALLLLTALFYGWYVSQHKIGTYGVETDFYGLYAKDAQRILNGQMVKERDHGPGYAGLIAFFMLLAGDVFVAGKLLSFLSSLGVIIFSYLLFRKLTDARISFWATFLLAIVLLPYSFIVGIDIVFTFFAVVAIWLFYEYLARKRYPYLIGAALVSGVAFMVRYNGILLPVGMIIVLLAMGSEGEKFLSRTRAAGIYLIFFLIPVLPWETYLFLEEKNASSPGLNLALEWEYYGPAGEFGGDQRMAIESGRVKLKYDSFGQYLRHEPISFLTHYAKNLISYSDRVLGAFFPFPGSHLILAGLVFYLLVADKLLLSLLLFPLFAYLGISLIHFYSRYYLFLVPFFSFYLAVFFFSSLWENIKPGMISFRWVRPVLLIWAVLALFRISFIKAQNDIQREPRYLIPMAQQMKSIVGRKSAVILARKPHFAFLSGIKAIVFPRLKTVEQLVQFAKENGIDYIEFGEAEKRYRPELGILMYPDSVRAVLRPVLMDSAKREIIYEVK